MSVPARIRRPDPYTSTAMSVPDSVIEPVPARIDTSPQVDP